MLKSKLWKRNRFMVALCRVLSHLENLENLEKSGNFVDREKSGNLIGGQGKCLEISVMFWSTYTGRGVHSLLTMKQSALLKK